MIVILDSGVLGLLVSPIKESSKLEDSITYQCGEWFYSLLAKGVYVVTSDISDYEVRRKLIHIKSESLVELDRLRNDGIIDFLPLTPEVMQKAAQCWAEVREKNISTADIKNIDADMIIVAQWSILCEEYPGQRVFIATTNVKHLKILAQDNAQEWMNIKV
ncbi:type II toxin-antitoxin system VapC family toxin [Planktothrix sp. FACHB-1365]|uniref:type II toxin-antitoxin system VapC family toxin n=1 Tax=Planktothrix sp. FACHB-1365 TaxID=2692855 RepID=UPI00168808C7|nr:type II toxin-antitoxin system VapC family toxin [Planktothrix sp. FACHB-1365]MBD2483480.1 type II toxin-antitoxin system VapC family toxin [Planktothrix sp. FACHB-1365]